MSASHWTFYILSAGIALAAILHLYHRREPAGRGRTLLALLRWGALAVLLLRNGLKKSALLRHAPARLGRRIGT